MKKTSFFAAAAVVLGLAACAQKPAEAAAEGADATAVENPAQEKTLKDFTPSKKQIDSVSYLVGIQFGSFLKNYNFGDLNMAQMKKGMDDFINAQGNQMDPSFVEQFKVNPELMNDIFGRYLESRQAYIGLENKQKQDKYLAANKKKDGVQTTESGLQYKIIEPGNMDVVAGPTDTVTVIYKGSLIDGTVFDQTPEGSEGIALALNRVIPGWSEGLQLVGEGGKIQLTIPSELGYGERGAQAIEPNSTLLFDVEVVKVAKKIEPVEAAE